MAGRCPGQDSRNLRSAYYKCSKCGNLVEIFSDELRCRCQQCGEYVLREAAPSCIEWCARARECLGEERWWALMGHSEASAPQDSSPKN